MSCASGGAGAFRLSELDGEPAESDEESDELESVRAPACCGGGERNEPNA